MDTVSECSHKTRVQPGTKSSHLSCRLLPFALLLILAIPCDSTFAGPPIFGFKAGLSISSQDYEYDIKAFTIERDPRVGLALSFLVEWNFSPILSVQPELGFVQRGSSLEVVRTSESSPDGIGSRKLEDRVDYIVLPLYVKAIVPSARYRPYAFAGPRLDWKVNEHTETSTIIANSYEPLVLGGAVGAGVEYGQGPVGAVIIEVVYQFDVSDAASATHVTVTNQSFLFLLGYMF